MGSYSDCGQVRKIIQTDFDCLPEPCPWSKLANVPRGGGQAVEIIAGRLTFLTVRSFEAFNANQDVQSALRYCIDRELVRSSSAALLRALGGPDEGFCQSCTDLTACLQIYYPFFKDFGPLDLGLAFRFCRKTAQLLQVPPLAFHLVLWQIWLADPNFATEYCELFGASSSMQVP